MTKSEFLQTVADKIRSNGIGGLTRALGVREVFNVLSDKVWSSDGGSDSLNQELEYDPNVVYNLTDPKFAFYNLRIFESKVDGNQGNYPPSQPDENGDWENQYWKEVSPAPTSAINKWSAGLFGSGLQIVFYSGELYKLADGVSRPFDSSDFNTELTNNKWERLSNKYDTTFDTNGKGLTPQSPGGTSQYLRADGSWSTPSGAGDMNKSTYDPNEDGSVLLADKINGASSAGNNKYYGTDGAGTPGFYSLPNTNLAFQASTAPANQRFDFNGQNQRNFRHSIGSDQTWEFYDGGSSLASVQDGHTCYIRVKLTADGPHVVTLPANTTVPDGADYDSANTALTLDGVSGDIFLIGLTYFNDGTNESYDFSVQKQQA